MSRPVIRVVREVLDRETRRTVRLATPRLVLITWTANGRAREEELSADEVLAIASDALAALQAVNR